MTVRLSVAGEVEQASNFHGGVHDTTRHWTAPTCRTWVLHWPYRNPLQQTLRWSQLLDGPQVQLHDQHCGAQMPARLPGVLHREQVALQSTM